MPKKNTCLPLRLSEKFEWGDIMAILYTGEEQKQRYRSTICLMLLQPRGSMSGSNVNVFCKSPPSSLLWMRFSTACTGGGFSCISTVQCNKWTMNCSALQLQKCITIAKPQCRMQSPFAPQPEIQPWFLMLSATQLPLSSRKIIRDKLKVGWDKSHWQSIW